MDLRRRWKPLLAVSVLVLGLLGYVGYDRWQGRCGAAVEEVSADDLAAPLLSADDLDDGVVEALDALPAPFGPVIAGRSWDEMTERPAVGTVDDDRLYLAAGGGLLGSEYDGSVVVVDAATGEGSWGIGVRGYGAGGGVVGDHFVTLGIPEDKAPEVAAYDLDSGDRSGCTKLGEDAETGFGSTLGSTDVGDDVVVAWRPGDSGLSVRRLDPVSGDEAWETEGVGSPSADVEVDDAGEVVVLSGIGANDSATDSIWQYGDVRGITALDADAGEVAWTWPHVDDPDAVAVRVKVVGTDADSGRVHVIEASRSQDAPKATDLVTLDASGAEVWRVPLRDYCEAGRWDALVVYACPGAPLAALDAATGDEVWASPKDYDPVGVIRPGPGRSVEVGDTRLQLADDGLVAVDLATGDLGQAVSEEDLGTYVSGIDLVGDHLVLSTETGVFVLEVDD